MAHQRIYSYRPRRSSVWKIVLAACGAVFMGTMAATNDRGLILFCIPMEKHAATVFYAVIGLVCAGAALTLGAQYQAHSDADRRVILTDSEIILPAGSPSQGEALVPFQRISRLVLPAEMNWARVEYAGGEFKLELDYLEPNEFLEIVDCLAKHCPIVRE